MLKTTTIRIDEELSEKLAEYAREKDLSKNQVVKRAIRKLIDQEGQPKEIG